MPRYFEQCPKCEHAPLPPEQALPAACPGCGLVFAKFAAIESSECGEALGERSDLIESAWERLRALMFHVPEPVSSTALCARAVLLLAFAVWGAKLIALDYRSGEINASFLHGPLLVFHEAGHVVFRVLGEFVMVFGGTLAQLLLPAIIALAFLIRNRDPFGAAIGTWLLGVSMLDVAPYVYDALEPQLILLGGQTGEQGGHDWIYLLGALGLTEKAHALGWVVHKLGAAIVIGSIAWGGGLLLEQRRRRIRKDA